MLLAALVLTAQLAHAPGVDPVPGGLYEPARTLFPALDARIAAPHATGRPARTRFLVSANVLFFGAMGALALAGSGHDRAAHGLAGFASSFGVGLLFKPTDGWAVGLALGVVKEEHDEQAYGGWDTVDLGATALGATAGYELLQAIR